MCCPVRAAQSQNVFAPKRGRTPLQRVQKVSKIKGLASVVQDLCRNNTLILEKGAGGCPARRADLRNVTSRSRQKRHMKAVENTVLLIVAPTKREIRQKK